MASHRFRRPMRSGLFVATVALLAPAASGQAPARGGLSDDPRLQEIGESILAGAVERAQAQIRSLKSNATPSERAELQPALELLAAAASSPLARPDAMVAVAERWPERREGEVALVAGLAAWVALRQDEYGLFAPLLSRSTPREPTIEESAREAFEAGNDARRGAFRRAVERLAQRADADRELEQRARLLLASLSTSTLEPLRLRAGESPALPRPRVEAVEIRIDRLPAFDTDLVAWFTGDHAAPPALERRIEAEDDAATLPPLAPGLYGVELRSPVTGWSGVRELLVSDLDLVVDRRGDACVVLALLGGRAQAGVEVTLDDGGEGNVVPEVGRTGADGTLLVKLDRGRCHLSGRFTDARGLHRTVDCWATPWDEVTYGWSRDPELVHWMVDAPLHRRGETVRGRILVRHDDERPLLTPAGTVDSQPVTRPIAHERFTLRFWPDTRAERIVRGTTDQDGLLAFELPLDDATPFGQVPACAERDGERGNEGNGSRDRSSRGQVLFTVEAIKRPPLLLEVGWPPAYEPGTPRPAVRVVARLPSGAPAGPLAGTLDLTLGSFQERHDFRLDAAGEASLPIACDTLPPTVRVRCDRVELRLSITAPDGQVFAESGSFGLAGTAPAAKPAVAGESVEALRFTSPTNPSKAGAAAELEVAGPAGATLLVTAGRAQIWWHQSVQLDANGRARVTIATRPEWRPGFEVRAASMTRRHGSIDEAKRWVEVGPAGGSVRAELDEHDARLAPGTRTTLHVTTRDDDGRPLPAIVSAAIVDESLFLLGPDRTEAPSRKLVPSPCFDWGSIECTPAAADPMAVVGAMFECGRMRPAAARGVSCGGMTAPGGAGGCMSAPPSLRENLRAVAAFVAKVKTGEDGRGSFTVDLPDDLTRWRVTLVAVDDDGRGEITRSSLVTVRDPCVQVVAPRFLRSGDELAIPAVAHAEQAPSRAVVLRADVSPDFVLPGADDLRDGAEPLAPGATISKLWPLRAAARAADHAWFSVDLLDAATGVRLDGERRELPIVSRSIERPTATTTVVTGGPAPPVVVDPPRLAGALSTRVTVELLGDRAALLESAGRWLEDYPYGCAEQTISRLVPIFAAARARRLARPADASTRRVDLTPAQARRFEAGMARLRTMTSGDGYAWWPGGRPDLRMTPVVLTGLALAREAGLEPSAYHAVADLRSGTMRDCVGALANAGGDPRVALPTVAGSRGFDRDWRDEDAAQVVAEVAVALLRYDPADGEARTAVEKLVATDAPLSTSLLFRAGLALVRAGSRGAAEHAFERATGPGPNPRCVVPLESAREALAAERLELARALERPRAEIDAAEAELLGLFDDHRFGTTWTTALALCALAGDDGSSSVASSDSRVVVRAGGQERIVRLDDSNRRHALLELGDVEDVELSSAVATHVVAVVTRRHEIDGVTSRGWSEPLEIERRVTRCGAGTPLDALADGSLVGRVGDCLEVEVTVRGPADLTYFAVSCPLPAGCELLGRSDEFERGGGTAEDARLVWAFSDLDEYGERTARARIVVAHAGVVGWPAAQAEAMYRPATSGASRGTLLVIEPAQEAPREEHLTWLSPQARTIQREGLMDQAAGLDSDPRSRSDGLWKLLRFPDDVSSELFERLTPLLIGSCDDVSALICLLGERRAALLDGNALSQLVAKAGWQELPMNCGLVREWACAFGDCAEGRALIERWVRDAAALGPIERRIAGAAVIEARTSRDALDPALALRALRADDFAGDDALVDSVRAEREELLARTRIDTELEEACRSVVEREGVRTRPRDAAAFAPFDRWQELLQFVRHELDRNDPCAESCHLADELCGWSVPELAGAAPFSEERALESSIASLRSSLAGALVRLVARGELPGFGWDEPGRKLMVLLDRAAVEAWLSTMVATADRAGEENGVDYVRHLLEDFSDKATLDSPLGRRLADVADRGRVEWCEAALRAFPLAERAKLPVELLAKRRGGYGDPDTPDDPSAWLLEDWRVDALAESDAGRARVLAASLAWERGDARDEPLGRVIPKCTAAELAALPDALLLDLFGLLKGDARERVRSDVVRRARESRTLAEAYAERLAEPQDPRTRELLVEAVAAAGPVQVIWDGNDPTADRYRTLLAARRGDKEALDELRVAIRANQDSPDRTLVQSEEELLVAEQTLLLHATLDDLADGLFGRLEHAEVQSRFAAVTDEAFVAWIDRLELDLAADPELVFNAVPRELLHRAWPRWLEVWPRASHRFPRDLRDSVVSIYEELTGRFLDSFGEPDARDPLPSDGDPRTLIRRRVTWDGRLPDPAREPRELLTAWRWELVERGLAMH